ncbi:PIN domain-containing protein [Aquisphaera insulae]|uniref:PIN domain-containing protein n=1 Tax=Aquisphaera insulae TaxID=2712864 RepID=UPI0013EBB9C1|nr:PIN domain-containing protein [Aquisphaera insulae]
MNKAILDTDTLSEIGKGKDPAIAGNARTYRRAFGHYTFSVITVLEIVRGFQQIHSQPRLNAFLATLPHVEVIPFDQREAELAGHIAGELHRLGRPIEMADTMIAATAITHGLELVTGNTAHHQRIQQIGYPLILVNWR